MCSHPLVDKLDLSLYFWDVVTRSSCIEGSNDYHLIKGLELGVYEHCTYM